MAFLSKEIKPLRFCILLVAAIGATVIGAKVWDNATAPKWKHLRIAMSRNEALAIMGEPIKVQEHENLVYLVYPSNRMYQATLTFKNGVLEYVDGGQKGAHLP
jgi:hypothetical protein